MVFNQGRWLVPLPQRDHICPAVPMARGPLLRVHVPAEGAVGPRSSGVRAMSGEMMLKVFEEEETGGRCFVCTHGPGRPVAAENWG